MAAKGKRGGRIIILVALILILAVGGVYVYLQMQQQQQNAAQTQVEQTPAVTMVSIVVTAQSIPRGAEITSDALTTVDYPEDKLVQGTFITDINSVIGSRAKYDLEPGVPLTNSELIQPSGGSVASFDVPENFVAMPIPVTQLTSVADALAPGDHVMVIGCMMLVDVDPDFQSKLPDTLDAIISPGATGSSGATSNVSGGTNTSGDTTSSEGDTLTAEGTVQGRAELDPTLNTPLYLIPSEAQRPRTVCQTVIQDAVVLRLGQYQEPVVQSTDTGTTDQTGTTQNTVAATTTTTTVTLVVSPQDAVSLNYILLTDITLNLALRNPSDTQPIVTDAVTQQYLMDQKNIPLPAKLPYALEPRVDSLSFPEVPSAQATTVSTGQ